MQQEREAFSFSKKEEEVLKYWKEKKIFEKTLAARKSSRPFVFFEGPPTANGMPGIHHVMARAFKDVILRYQTMRGRYVERRAGWDTHGLPVEIGLEKALGLKSKQDIEKYGIAEFNAKAKESVWEYKKEWEKMTERIGFWLDFENPYITYDPKYIETLWWIVAQIWKRGMLQKLHKVVPWCPRCETTLSSHELAMPGGYKETTDPSVFLKVRIKREPVRRAQGEQVKVNNEYLLIWTTTPWTLPANMAVAVKPSAEYNQYELNGELFWSLVPPPGALGASATILQTKKGKELIGLHYESLFPNKTKSKAPNLYSVIAGEFVATNEGTGFVHIAPSYGEEDIAVWRAANPKHGEDILTSVDDRGIMAKGFPGAGTFAKKADTAIIEHLAKKGLVYQAGTLSHEYPFCWRCSTPLLYRARREWFVTMSKLRKELVEANQDIHWVPEHLKTGRFGEWLKEAKDWAFSRERYWGTPLPIWECKKCESVEVIDSYAAIDKKTNHNNCYFLVRHGEAYHNIKKYFAGGKESTKNAAHLTEKGKQDIAELAANLKKEKIQYIYSSPFARARETAAIIAKATKAKVVIDKRLGELDGGVFNQKPLQNYFDFFTNQKERLTKAPEKGENLIEVKARMWQVFVDIEKKHIGKNIAIVSHGDPLRMLEAALGRTANENVFALPDIKPAEMRRVEYFAGSYTPSGDFDPHRPYSDAITFECEKCKKGTMKRVSAVADVWFDSGSMPFALWHYPFENKEMIDDSAKKSASSYPADYISEGIDQTRGWFYSLLNVALLLGKETPYQNVVSLGLLLDKNGQKMSKSKGNTVNPNEMIAIYGADAVRWYFLSANDPGEFRRFDEQELGLVVRKVFLIAWNSLQFLNGAAAGKIVAQKSENLLDRWLAARVSETEKNVRTALDSYSIGKAVKEIEMLINDLSIWYIRRSRRRLQDGHAGGLYALHSALRSVALFMAPFAPMVSDMFYKSLPVAGESAQKESVHLEDWPLSQGVAENKELIVNMARVREYASMGLRARAEAKIKVRQPLAKFTLHGTDALAIEYQDILKDEVNVKVIEFVSGGKELRAEFDTVITPALKKEGFVREAIRAFQDLRKDAGLKRGERIALAFGGSAEQCNMLKSESTLFMETLAADEAGFFLLDSVQKDGFTAHLETTLEGEKVFLGLKRTE